MQCAKHGFRSRAGTVPNDVPGDAISVRINIASVLSPKLQCESRFGGCQANLRDNLSRLTVCSCVSTPALFNVIRPVEDSLRLRYRDTDLAGFWWIPYRCSSGLSRASSDLGKAGVGDAHDFSHRLFVQSLIGPHDLALVRNPDAPAISNRPVWPVEQLCILSSASGS